ncbi:MAG TPA: hypothetical protein VGA24_09120 [Steroidobacteraceae bacterium]
MTRLPSSLAQIALLRKDPGILPASLLLSALLALGYAGANAFLAYVDDAERILLRTAVDLGLALAFFWMLLVLTRRTHRLPQTLSAVFGTYVLLAPAMTLLIMLGGPAKTNYAAWLLTNAGSTVITIWYLLIVGHILKSALDTGLVTGFAIAVTWAVASVAIARSLFPVAT